MKRVRLLFSLPLALALTLVSMSALASAMVLKMGLGELVGNADMVFRGTVLTKEPGTVQAGGAELPTVIYTIKVDDALKGDFGAKPIMTVTMLGNLKKEAVGDVQHLASLDLNPDLSVGGEYVLFTTTPGASGLSTTVGLGQGLFKIFADANGRDLVANELNNMGLFDGPVQYSELAQAVAALLAQ